MPRIVTFNMWGRYGPFKKRWELACRFVPAIRADFLCLQEATHPAHLKALAASLRMKIAISDEDSTGLAMLSRWEFKNARMQEYKARSPFEPYIRKFQCLRIRLSGKPFFLLNTHLSWKPQDDATRIKQAEELIRFSESLPHPAILCGDFNAQYRSKALAAFRKSGFDDVLSKTSDAAKPTWDNANPHIQGHTVKFPNRRIDLILCPKTLQKTHRVSNAGILFNEPVEDGLHLSDHYAVLVELKSIR